MKFKFEIQILVNLIIFDVEGMFRWLVLLLSKYKLFLIHIICYSSVLVVLEFSIPKYRNSTLSLCLSSYLYVAVSFPLITSTNNFRLQCTNADKGERRRKRSNRQKMYFPTVTFWFSVARRTFYLILIKICVSEIVDIGKKEWPDIINGLLSVCTFNALMNLLLTIDTFLTERYEYKNVSCSLTVLISDIIWYIWAPTRPHLLSLIKASSIFFLPSQ